MPRMMPLSATLDSLLCLACLILALASARAGNDLLFSGLLWVAVAAFAGTLNLGGFAEIRPTHAWLSQVARGPGMLTLALGVLAAEFGPVAGTRWMALSLSIVGAGFIQYMSGSPRLELVATLLGSTLPLAMLILSVKAIREARLKQAGAAGAAIVLLLFAGFGVSQVPLSTGGLIRHVDILHVVLIACYSSIWLAVRPSARASECNRMP